MSSSPGEDGGQPFASSMVYGPWSWSHLQPLRFFPRGVDHEKKTWRGRLDEKGKKQKWPRPDFDDGESTCQVLLSTRTLIRLLLSKYRRGKLCGYRLYVKKPSCKNRVPSIRWTDTSLSLTIITGQNNLHDVEAVIQSTDGCDRSSRSMPDGPSHLSPVTKKIAGSWLVPFRSLALAERL